SVTGTPSASGHEPAGELEAPRVVGGEDDELGRRRLDSRQRKDNGTVRDEHEVAAGGPAPSDVPERAHLLGLSGVGVEEVAERRPGPRAAEGEPRGLEAATPRARQHAADGNAARPERVANTTGVLAARIGQVALGRTVLEPEAGWIPDARRGDR